MDGCTKGADAVRLKIIITMALLIVATGNAQAEQLAKSPNHPSSLVVSRYGISVKASAIKSSDPLCVGMTPEKFQRLTPRQESEAIACNVPKGLVTISERGKAIFAERLPQLNWVDFIRIIEPRSWMMEEKVDAIKSHPAIIVGYASCGGSCAHSMRAYVYDLINPKGGYVAVDIYGQVTRNELTRNVDLTFQRIQAVTAAGADHFGSGLFVAQAASCGPMHFIVIDGARRPHAGDYIMGAGWDEPGASLDFVYAKPSEYRALDLSCE